MTEPTTRVIRINFLTQEVSVKVPKEQSLRKTITECFKQNGWKLPKNWSYTVEDAEGVEKELRMTSTMLFDGDVISVFSTE